MIPLDTYQLLGVIIASLHNFISKMINPCTFRSNGQMMFGYAKADNKCAVIGKHRLIPRNFWH